MLVNTPEQLKNTPLHEKHIALGAKMVPFSGWNMPVQYTGIIDEHLHTREKAGLFDICHMGEFMLKGPAVEKDLNKLLSRRVDDLTPGKCRYSFMLNEGGGIIDDLIVYRTSGEEFMLVVNAGTISKDREWVKKNISSGTKFLDESDRTAKLDLQGPSSGDIMAGLLGDKTVNGLKRFNFTHIKVNDTTTMLSRTGYTGELGYELFMPVSAAEEVWDTLMGFEDVRPIGLGARDTLRLEAGYSLYGSDIDEEHTPLEANLERFVSFDKDFTGKDALLEQKEEGPGRLLTGFICEGRRSARSHFKVLREGKEIGEVTSGAFSPCLKKGIGLCYLNKEFSVEGKEIILTDGKVEIEAKVKSLPIYEHS
ncbi:MAG: glycine cleavage system aminomethyltransferase GcvT [Candidatus Omnitrophica bacterium]|nr:glycine cleavage system aminomethyltransferase GcvT [Candidatus Omnitrophota bacterium]